MHFSKFAFSPEGYQPIGPIATKMRIKATVFK